MILVLLACTGLWWMVKRARVQRDAVAALEQAGGIVRYDWERPRIHRASNGKPWPPRWPLDRLGLDYFGHVVLVQVYPNRVAANADSVLQHIGNLGRLEGSPAHTAADCPCRLVLSKFS